MKKTTQNFIDIFTRYLILVLIAIPNLWIFYFIFTPLTVYSVFFLLKMSFEIVISGNILIINQSIPIELIKACIAGSAYYLLLILNLSTSKISFTNRIKIIFFSFLALLIINIIRIYILTMIFLENLPGFILTHEFFWYFMSTIFVVCIWFFGVRIFKIKEIPFYSDIKFLYKNLN